jgi:hypothetical protein
MSVIPSYPGNANRRIIVQQKVRPYFKNNHKKGWLSSSSGRGPEFNPQYWKIKKVLSSLKPFKVGPSVTCSLNHWQAQDHLSYSHTWAWSLCHVQRVWYKKSCSPVPDPRNFVTHRPGLVGEVQVPRSWVSVLWEKGPISVFCLRLWGHHICR